MKILITNLSGRSYPLDITPNYPLKIPMKCVAVFKTNEQSDLGS